MTRTRHAPTALTAESADDPFIRSRMRRAAVGLLCLKIVALPILFDRSADVAFTVPKALFSHASAYLLAAVIAGLALRFRASAHWRSPLHLAVLAYVVVNIAATAIAEDRYLALFGAHERMLGLGTLIDCVVLFFAASFVLRTPRDSVAVAVSVFGAAAIVLAYEAIQLARLDPLPWSGATHIRPPSTIGQANSLAEYLVVVATGAGALVVFGRPRPRLVVALLTVCASALLGAVLTQTRSVLLGVAGAELALITLVWVHYRSGAQRARYTLGAVATGVAFAGALLLTPLGSRVATTVDLAPPGDEPASTSPRVEAAADVRLALYGMSLRMVAERPILGHGPDNFVAVQAKHRSDAEPYEVQANANSSAHSWVAQVATSSGLLGLVTFIVIAVAAVGAALRSRDPIASIGAVAMCAFLAQGSTTVNEISTEWLFWGAVGLVASSSVRTGAPLPAASAGRQRRRAQQRAEPPEDPRFLAAAAVLIAVGTMLAASTWVALDASRSAHASLVARVSGRTADAIEHARRATQRDPGRSEYWHALGLARAAAGRPTDAVAALEHAYQLAPYDVNTGSSYVRALLLLGQRADVTATERAGVVADRLVRTDPNNPVAHVTRALAMRATGDLEQAVVSVWRAVALDRTSPSGQTALRDTYVVGVQVLSAAGRHVDALTLADLGLSRLPGADIQVPLRIERARALAQGGRFEEAIRELDTVLAQQPRNSAALELRAQIEVARPK